MATRILFILKFREVAKDVDKIEETWAPKKGLSSGLLNSAGFVNSMLQTFDKNDIVSEIIQVNDNNDIDREVTKFKPNIVIIEAYWVVSSKFEVLTKLHPNVKWIIRNHSNIPFLANEGIAFGWTLEYVKFPTVYVSCNHIDALIDVRNLIRSAFPEWTNDFVDNKIVFLPNYYPIKKVEKKVYDNNRDSIDIGCFGAIRPLKNHMIQALAAIEWARVNKKYLRFHINGNRVEGNGAPILKNLRETFSRLPNAELIEHGWLDHTPFLELVKTMDLGLQVSVTETFNIVCADFISQGIPVVASREIHWVDERLHVQNITNSLDIIKVMDLALESNTWKVYDQSVEQLSLHSENAKKQWYYALKTI
jgi:hypothetical protein